VGFANDPMTTPGVGAWVGKMYQPPWLDKI
jgi:hypothetical protein